MLRYVSPQERCYCEAKLIYFGTRYELYGCAHTAGEAGIFSKQVSKLGALYE